MHCKKPIFYIKYRNECSYKQCKICFDLKKSSLGNSFKQYNAFLMIHAGYESGDIA